MTLAPGLFRCNQCGVVYAHDAGYRHWIERHAPKEKTVTRKEILNQRLKGEPV